VHSPPTYKFARANQILCPYSMLSSHLSSLKHNNVLRSARLQWRRPVTVFCNRMLIPIISVYWLPTLKGFGSSIFVMAKLCKCKCNIELNRFYLHFA
jgi:hypothetical protein